MSRGIAAPIGTQRTSQNGYLYQKTDKGWQLVHRIVAEKKLGRSLEEWEYVSFVDGDKNNHEPTNIEVLIRGRSSTRRRLAVVEQRLIELNAERDHLLKRLERQEKL